LIYGGEQGHHTKFFKQAEEGKVIVPGNGSNVIALGHIDDVVGGIVKVIEADPKLVAGQVFHFSSDTSPTLGEVAKAFSTAAGFHGQLEHGAFPVSIFDVHVGFDTSKAKRVLGWKPTRPDVIQEAPILYKAWKSGGFPVVF